MNFNLSTKGITRAYFHLICKVKVSYIKFTKLGTKVSVKLSPITWEISFFLIQFYFFGGIFLIKELIMKNIAPGKKAPNWNTQLASNQTWYSTGTMYTSSKVETTKQYHFAFLEDQFDFYP